MIGICGCHRTGKTTLTNALPSLISSDRFVANEMKTEAMLKQLGVTAQSKMSLSRRITIQRQLLQMYEKRLEELHRQEKTEGQRVFVIDRTPIDVVAYLLVNAGCQETALLSQGQTEAIEKLLTDALCLTSKYFEMVVHLPLGINVVEHSAKASCNAAFMTHLDLIIRGILQRNEGHSDQESAFPLICWIDEDMTDLKERALCVNGTYRRVLIENASQPTPV